MRPASESELKAVLPGFEHISRYWDRQHATVAAKILPGEYYVTLHKELVTTVLGSCVSACIRDRRLGVGGMNHFMLPLSEDGDWGGSPGVISSATRYGNYAMEHMINEILKHGGQRRNFEAKIFGGGRIMKNLSDVGARNIEFVNCYLETEKIPIVGQDVGDIFPRKIVYFPDSGRALVKRIKHLHNDTVVRRETAYHDELVHQKVQSDIELF